MFLILGLKKDENTFVFLFLFCPEQKTHMCFLCFFCPQKKTHMCFLPSGGLTSKCSPDWFVWGASLSKFAETTSNLAALREPHSVADPPSTTPNQLTTQVWAGKLSKRIAVECQRTSNLEFAATCKSWKTMKNLYKKQHHTYKKHKKTTKKLSMLSYF